MKKNNRQNEPAQPAEMPIENTASAVEAQAADMPVDSPEDQGGEQTDASQLDLLSDRLKAKEKELSEVSDKYLRIAAEYDNYRRRSQKEKESLYVDSVTHVVKEWLPVLDNLDRASQIVEEAKTEEAVRIGAGIEMVRKQAYEVMAKLGVLEIDCLNKPFDPNQHDAVMHVEDDSVGASTVVEVLQKGYQRGDVIIRHSIVKVAN